MAKTVAPPDKLAEMRALAIAEAATVPDVIALATAIMFKTSIWANKQGIIIATSAKKPPSAKSKEIGNLIDQCIADGNCSLNQFTFRTILKCFEVIIGEEIPSKGTQGSGTRTKFENGTAITMKANLHEHEYPLDSTIIVTNANELMGVTESGNTPSKGYHFESEKDVIGIPTEAEVVLCLANMYFVNPARFVEIQGMV